MSDQYDPVRAWTEYDHWQELHWIPEPRGGERWERYSIPKDGGRMPSVSVTTYATLEQSIKTGADLKDAGPLRSLRVLLRSGHEVTLDVAEALVVDDHPDLGYDAEWRLSIPDEHGPWMKQIASWDWADGSDTEAVSRALSEARRWLEENRQEATE